MPNLHQQDEVMDSVKARAKIKLERDLGPEIMAALADPKTVEIMLNSDGKLWQERLGEKMRPIGALSASRSESIIKTIAGFHGKEITKGRPPHRMRTAPRWLSLCRAISAYRASTHLCDSKKSSRHLHSGSVRRDWHHDPGTVSRH